MLFLLFWRWISLKSDLRIHPFFCLYYNRKKVLIFLKKHSLAARIKQTFPTGFFERKRYCYPVQHRKIAFCFPVNQDLKSKTSLSSFIVLEKKVLHPTIAWCLFLQIAHLGWYVFPFLLHFFVRLAMILVIFSQIIYYFFINQ